MRAPLCMVVIVLATSGCASQNFSIHSLPAETPAAANAAAIKGAAARVATQTGEVHRAAEEDGASTAPPVTTADAPSMYSYDPWERLNRFTYRFNTRFDEAVFLPVANGYRRVPEPIRSGVNNFFKNLAEVESILNYAAQLRPKHSAHGLGRFVINSTLGIGGLFDVAKRFNLEGELTGFGTTLAKWGMHPGPYFVMPLLGPATLRDGIGLLGDFGVAYVIDVAHIYRGNKTYALGTVDSVDQRSNVSFRYYSTGSPFEYETVRFLYVHKELIEDAALHAKGPPPKHDAGKEAGQ
jgi:phospholipid-binding lipoprotein MlaA